MSDANGAAGAIEVLGAREHNLRDVDVRIPKGALTVVTGVSGSGKSSLVLHTIAAESQRQLFETYPAFVRDRLPKRRRPAATALRHLTPVVVVDQRPVGGGVRSTVGTMTEISTLLRILFSRVGRPSAGESSAYSFNDPAGMCPACEGLGRRRAVVVERLIDADRSLAQEAIRFPGYERGSWQWRLYADSGLFDPDLPIGRFDAAERELLLRGDGFKVQLGTRKGRLPARSGGNRYEGVLRRVERLVLAREPGRLSDAEREALARVVEEMPCDACGGQRLNAAARASRVGGRTIAELSALEASDLIAALAAIEEPEARPLVAAAQAGLRRMADVGLGYLSLDRATPTLSGGEAQRLKTIRHLGSSLSGMTYVFDEPSSGLHPHDVERLTRLLRELRDAGNTVLVVEHDRDVIAAADHVVDLGPGAGAEGGRVVYAGDLDGLRASDTRTARALRRRREPARTPRRPAGTLAIRVARRHNVRDVAVELPLGVLTAVTGVAGSGKSTLVAELARQHAGVAVIDQGPIAASSRSTIASYVGVLDRIRARFAAVSGRRPGLFSFNSLGACPRCRGRGVVTTDLAFMAPVTRVCEACEGVRFRPEALAHRWDGRTIVDVLALSVEEVLARLDDAAVAERVRPLHEVGAGHLTLGRTLDTLSGGERQRVKIADRLEQRGGILVLDEPTTGLHADDVAALLALLDRLVDGGATVVAVEHDLDVVAHADWVLDMGPGAGRHGGRIVFAGTPAELLAARGSATAEHLRRR